MSLSGPSFTYPSTSDEAFASVLALLDPEQAFTAQGLLSDRDYALEDQFARILNGTATSSSVVSYATGGSTISYGKNFTKAPVVLVSMGDGPLGVIPFVDATSLTAVDFKVLLSDGTGTEIPAGGSYRINWIATGS